MAYNNSFSNRLREALENLKGLEKRKCLEEFFKTISYFSGLSFLVHSCVLTKVPLLNF